MEIHDAHDAYFKKLPIVIPCVFYHGKEEWKVGLSLSDLYDEVPADLKKYVLDFEYLLIHNRNQHKNCGKGVY